MKPATKAKINALEFLITSARIVQKTNDARLKLEACALELEFTERVAALRKAEKEPELALPAHSEG